jgi:hypothetical protein
MESGTSRSFAMDTDRTWPPWVGALSGLAVLLAVFTGSGCARTIEGQVLDAQTGQPIAGAVVLGVWIGGGGMPGLSHAVLLGVREAETDTEGRFVLESLWRPFIEERITAYKVGYLGWSNLFLFPSLKRRDDRRVPPEIRLDHFSPGVRHSDHMDFIHLATGSSVSSGSWVKFRGAIDREERMR